MFTIRIHAIVFELSSLTKERKKKERRRTKPKFSCIVFSNTIKVSAAFTVHLAIELPRDGVYKHYAFVCFIFHGAAPILYVQATILKPG